MKIKRLTAYFIDFMIITFISSMIFALPMFKEDYNEYTKVYEEYTTEMTNELNSGSAEVNDEKLLSLNYKVLKSTTKLSIITLTVTIVYFGIIAYLLKGQTLGKKLFKIKVTDLEGNLPNPGLFMLRSIILTNFIPQVVSLFILILASEKTYIDTNVYISYITMLLYFLIVGFIIFRTDERGLHDIICKTKVIEINTENKA
ncbi:MAG: RDD family protein [Bacilli bacterium]|nr:RDD family protein [Bacilli bacterium]